MDKTEMARQMNKRLVAVENTWPKQAGKSVYMKYLSGSKLTYKQTVNAKCYDCMGGYPDGKVDCNVSCCSLYPFMPHRDKTNIITPV